MMPEALYNKQMLVHKTMLEEFSGQDPFLKFHQVRSMSTDWKTKSFNSF
jgi:hypothetical protein